MDKRKHHRLLKQASIYLDYAELDGENALQSKILISQCNDISSSGVGFCFSHALPLSAIYQLALHIQGQVFHLVGQVKWMQALDSGDFSIGLELLDSQDTDIVAWKKWLAQQYLSTSI
ncbi:MAG: PilZ domain-containing protein [Pseudomonadales bacterium]|nr:PilZ domain-containing protein [Pseudomonadales bacterium]